MTVGDLDDLVALVCERAATVPGDVRGVVEQQADRFAPLATPAERAALIARSIARLDGLDELELLLADPSVDEVMVNRGSEVWTDRGGIVERAGTLPPGAIEVVLERVLSPLGRRLDRSSPIVDARLDDGARLCAVVPPVAVDGTTVSIRRHHRRRVPLERFAPPAVRALLGEIVERRANVLVTGATSSGKTTLLAAMVAVADPADRLVVIEDTTELALGDRHAVRLEARAAGVDGVRAVDAAELVRTALRLRPDRLIVGEFRGVEVIAVVQALNTGHDGSLSTCHANSALDGLRRVETLVLQSAPGWPLAAIRRHVTRSLDVVVHLRRADDGERRVTEVVEVIEGDGEPAGRPLIVDGAVSGELTRGRR